MTVRRVFQSVAFALLVPLLTILSVVAQQPDQWNGVCNPSSERTYYKAGVVQCGTCPINSFYDTKTMSCKCKTGYATNVNATTGEIQCDDCGAQGFVLSTTTNRCIPCGGELPVALVQSASNSTAASALPFVTVLIDSVTNSNLSYGIHPAALDNTSCSCARPGIVQSKLIDSFGGVFLGFYACLGCFREGVSVPCEGGCPAPQEYNTASGSCQCPVPKYLTDVDGRCMFAHEFNALATQIGSIPLAVPMLNVDNKGTSGSAVASWMIAEYTSSSAYWCSKGNDTACNLLSNLCVLSAYDLGSAPCTLYRALQLLETCRALACEVPTTVPWLYYLRSSPMILQTDALGVKVALEQKEGFVTKLELVMGSYAWNGTWLGNTLVTNQFQVCDIPAVDSESFLQVGANRRVYCFLNHRWFVEAPETVFYELFLRESDGNLADIPVLLDYSKTDLYPHDIHDSVIYREGSAGDGTPIASGYRRRFYMYDNIGAVPKRGGTVSGVTFARRVMLLVSLQPNHASQIYTPLLIVQYASATTSGFLENPLWKFGQNRQLKTNKSDGAHSTSASTEVKYTMDNYYTEEALMITLTTFCCICFFSAWARTYSWSRRQQDTLPGVYAFVRFFFYACNHVANIFLLVIVITSGYFYLFYKHQSSVEFLLPDGSNYFFAMLYTATVTKGLVVIYKIIEQCKIDWFVVDWERSRGTLLRENKEASVTMWRSTFIANELNELQIFRYWNPLFCMVLIMVFLEGAQYINLAQTIPEASYKESSFSYPHPILRVAVDSFFWVIVPLTLYVLQWHIYYRFLEVHPLRGFIDLCSVSNISVVMLLEDQYGFYIHGESIHAHSDTSMAEFQENLRREAQGNLVNRGLGATEFQVFEVYIGGWLRQGLTVSYFELLEEYGKALGGAVGKPTAGKHRSIFEVATGSPGQVQVFTERTLEIKANINDLFRNSVRAGEKVFRNKDPMHSFLDFTPNLLWMNGPFAGEARGSDLYFVDTFDAWVKCLLAGIDGDLWCLYLLLFCSIDSSLSNSYVAVAIVYVLDIIFVWFRETQGQANLGAKTLFDERFFV